MSTVEETETGDQLRTARLRSPNFPYIDLRSAIEKSKVMYGFAKFTPVLQEGILSKWDYSATSSSAKKVVAALISYGLLDATGTGAKRKLQLTDRSKNIILGADGAANKVAAIEDAAMAPAMYAYMHEHFGPSDVMPDDKVVIAHLTIEKNFAESGAKAFLRDYKKTMEFAGLNAIGNLEDGISHDADTEKERSEIAKIGDYIQWESAGTLQFTEAQKVRHVSDDDAWVFVESSETGIPMSEITVEQAGNCASMPSPTMPLERGAVHAEKGESLFFRSKLSSEASVRIMSVGDIGAKELEKLIKVLTAQQEILKDD